MRSVRNKLRIWTASILDLPQDVTHHLPRLTAIGNKELYIENHQGVLHFSDDRLILAIPGGQLEINGQQLAIHSILSEEVRIEGTITEIKYRI